MVTGDGEFLTIARVAKTQGRVGEVACDLHTDFPEKFAERKQVFGLSPDKKTVRRELTVEDFWLHKGRVVLKFAGVDSITQAEELIGLELQIPASERATLEPGAAYLSELIGCTVLDQGRLVGTIRLVDMDVSDTAILVVVNAAGDCEYLIPWVKDFVEQLDVAGRELRMKLPEGLLEIYSA